MSGGHSLARYGDSIKVPSGAPESSERMADPLMGMTNFWSYWGDP
jgi:hypothetical protein